MKRQSERTASNNSGDRPEDLRDGGASTPKRMPSLLRVTYFDDFDLFRTAPGDKLNVIGGGAPVLDTAAAAAAAPKPGQINYNKSSSANDLDAAGPAATACLTATRRNEISCSNKSQSLDKQQIETSPASQKESFTARASLSETGTVAAAMMSPGGGHNLSSSSRRTSNSPCSTATTSNSSQEIFQSGCSHVEPTEEEFNTPRSRGSSTASSGPVSSRSRNEDDTIVQSDCDSTSAVAKSSSQISTSSAVSAHKYSQLGAGEGTSLCSADEEAGGGGSWKGIENLTFPGTTMIYNEMTVASSDSVEPSCGGDLLSGSTVKVLLERVPDTSFGICIVGGQVNLSGNTKIAGVFIKNIIPKSPADRCNVLQVGDRILAVDDTNLKDASHQYAVSVIKNAGLSIRLTVERFHKWQNDIFNVCDGDDKGLTLDKCQPPPVTPARTPECIVVQGPAKSAVAAAKGKAPGAPDSVATDAIEAFDGKETIVKIRDDNVNGAKEGQDGGAEATTGAKHTITANDDNDYSGSSGGSSSEDDEDEREMTGRIYTKAGIEIDRASAGNVKLSKMELAKADSEVEDEFGYTAFKLRKRYGALGSIVQHSMQRSTKSGGTMGISLAGHRDRNKMACFIAGINPRGCAAQSELRVGDEILEVNGIVLHGRSHLNASAIIKTLPGPSIKFILLRREPAKALEELAVKPVTQFPIDLDTEADAMATSSFKNLRHLSMQKCGPSLGIMIIEGKHSDVGQGIFVSDIQEGSVAERAGLAVGDMILSVNGDSLLNCNYETAAGMLKKTEGVVALKVCNPNRRESCAGEISAIPEAGTLRVNDDKSTSRRSLDRPASANEDRKSLANASQPVTPKSHKSNKELGGTEIAKEITANKECIIEVNAEKKLLGLICVGGKDSPIKLGATVIVAVRKQGAAAKDGRLKVFDQVLEINGVKLTGDKSSDSIQKTMKLINDKITLTVWRSEPPDTESVEIDLPKKSGKDLGICCGEENGYGVVVTDLLSGGVAEADGRIQRGDIISHVNGDQLANQPIDLCSVLLKTASGRITLKILRPAPKTR